MPSFVAPLIKSYIQSWQSENWALAVPCLVLFVAGLVGLSKYLSKLAPLERTRKDKLSAKKRRRLVYLAVLFGVAWLVLLPTHTAASYLIPFAVNIVFLIIVAVIYKTREWSADDFFRLALIIVAWTSTCNAFSLNRDNLSWHNFATSFLEASAVYFGLWALYGIWLTIYTARLRQGQAMSYDFMLTHISDLFDRTLAAARQEFALEFNRLKNVDQAIDAVAERHTVQMVLFTPSNGNVSCHKLSKYEKYRDKLLAFAEEREVSVELICLSEEAIKKYYGSYFEQAVTKAQKATDAEKNTYEAEKTYIQIACAEAICLFRRLEEISRDRSKNFSLVTKHKLGELLPEHLIAAPLEAWLWVPHRGPRHLSDTECELPQWYNSITDEAARFEKAKAELHEAAKRRSRPHQLECLAFRTEDTVARHEITTWIVDTTRAAAAPAAAAP